MKTTRFTPFLAACSTLALLAGCAADSDWGREAGSVIEAASFGQATLNNTGIHSGELSYAINLAERFAREVNSTVNFAFNSAILDQAARSILRQQANWIRQFPEVRFKVYGHTDLVGSNAYNKRLGLRRARAIVAYFASQGISRTRLEAVVSHGENQPMVATQGREARNRRTITEVSGFVQSNQLILNGKYAAVVFREYIASAIPRPRQGATTGIGAGE